MKYFTVTIAVTVICISELATAVLISPFIVKHIKRRFLKECWKQSGLTATIMEEATARAIKCGFDFDNTPEYEKFHVCLETKEGFYEANTGEVVLERLYQKWNFFDREYVLKMHNACHSHLKDVPVDYHRKYMMGVCFAIYAGNFPHNTKHLGVLNITPDMITQCRIDVDWPEEDFCRAYTATDRDGFEGDQKGMCYHTCLLERVGYLQGTTIDRIKIRARFDYIGDDKFDQVYGECVRDFTEAEKCAASYEIHKCLKIGFGEYPVPVRELN